MEREIIQAHDNDPQFWRPSAVRRIGSSSCPRARRPDRAAVLLVILLMMAVAVPLVCVLLEAQTTQVRITHNVAGDVAALYVAEAGVHDAISQLLLSSTWRTGFTNKIFPADLGHTYTVTLADTPPGKITVTSTSQTVDGYSKTVTAVVSGF